MSRPAAVEEAPAASSGAGSSYRHDIDGLRALAIALVVVYHVWLGRVSGGVDVFLMISAYFLTASFVRKAERGGSLGVVAAWVRRFCRLLPAAAVTILAVLGAVWALYPPSRWEGIWAQGWASLFYFQNWELATSAVDYYDRDPGAVSPLQHFWSLSVQGQVFLLWPVVIVLGVAIARRSGRAIRPTLALLFGMIFVASLIYSIVTTYGSNQEFAYFDTFARLWEFAFGSLLALWIPRAFAWPWVAAAFAWIGLAGLVLCGVLMDVQGGFPGYLALWPLLCAAAVIVTGASAPAGGPWRFLRSPALRTIGRNAYALYLVHWPVLITWMLVAGVSRLDIWSGLAVIVISWVLAVGLSRFVERPVRRVAEARTSLRGSITVIVAALAVVAVPLASWQVAAAARAAHIESSAVADNPGAAILMDAALPAPSETAVLLPLGSDISGEWVAFDGACDGARAPSDPRISDACLQSTPPDDPAATILVVGNSHAQQWAGALLPLAEEGDWQIIALLKGGCSFGLDEPPVPGVEGCEEWREAVLDYAMSSSPDAVVTVGTAGEVDGPGERLLEGLDRAVGQLADAGTPVVVLRDNPRASRDLFQCVERWGPDSPRCDRPRERSLADVNPAAGLEREGVAVVDLSDYLCPDGVCRTVIGNVAVYLDDNHLTNRYARSMAPALNEALSVYDWWPEVNYWPRPVE